MFYVFLLFFFASMGWSAEVILYTALDRMHSEPVIQMFEKKTGIKVKAVYDTEATKTAGLVNRLIAEKKKPKADVFWNNEIVRTIVLKKKGILQPYISSMAREIPAGFKDPQGYWTGFAARARVLIVNTNKLKPARYPRSILDFTKPEWKGKFCIANPLFGTTSAHISALFSVWGDEKAMAYFKLLKANNVAVLAGNATNKDRVAAGIYPAGFTDTDDASIALIDKKPVVMVFPDQKGMGTLLIPNTLGLIAGCPHPQEGRALIDFLLSSEVEAYLAASSSIQIPLRPGVKGPSRVPPLEKLKVMRVDFEKAADVLDGALKKLEKLLLR